MRINEILIYPLLYAAMKSILQQLILLWPSYLTTATYLTMILKHLE